MRTRWTAGLIAALVAALGLAACGEEEQGDGGGRAPGNTLTIYSSLPLQGSNRPQSLDVVNGMKLALEQRGGKVGRFTIRYRSLDDSTAQAGKWEAGATSANARRAAQDDTTIAYLGEFNSGASAISIPLTNDAGILQISPANTALELTKDAGPEDKGAPEKYYPTGKRNYARVIPADHIQGSAQADWQKELGVRKLYILNDKEVYGAGVAKTTADAAKRRGIQVLANEGIDPKAPNYRAVAAKVKQAGADAVFFGGITQNNAAQLFKDLNAALPQARLFGPDGVAETEFAKDLPEAVQRQTYITVATIDPEDYPPEGQRFFEDFEREFNDPEPQPYAIYGFEAMALALDAIERAGPRGNDRQAVIDQVFRTKNRRSVVGTYDIDKDGDVTVNQFGRYLVKRGDIDFLETVQVKEDSFGRPLGQ
ncbi:MAG: branched-chain amino acid ABC transporter substrate-binding protein [Actinomycetota bacterium]|nr:branched-chain amino acid ABC transporter substrate-binding protein [Actinomycetota bacterium]